MSGHNLHLLISALCGAVTPPDRWPAGEHEIQVAMEGRANGEFEAVGFHGRLSVAPQAVPMEELLEAALCELIQALPPKRRREALLGLGARATALVHDEDAAAWQHRADARRVLRVLERRTGLTWRATPTHKPRDRARKV